MAFSTYQDDILDPSMDGLRQYNMINNENGSVSFQDVTLYSQDGSDFGASDINAIIDAIEDIDADYVPTSGGVLVNPTLNGSISIGGTPTFSDNATRDAWVSALSLNGDVYNSNADNVNCASGTVTTLCNTGSLVPGVYLFIVNANFPSNASGRRGVLLSWSNTGSAIDRYSSTNVAPVNGDTTRVIFSVIQKITSSSTAYLRVYQNCGSAMSVGGGIRRIRLHY